MEADLQESRQSMDTDYKWKSEKNDSRAAAVSHSSAID